MCLVFLFHVRSGLVAVIALPVGILLAMIVVRMQGLTLNIMSLGGIAVAIGTMVDAGIVMVENAHRHLARDGGKGRTGRSSPMPRGKSARRSSSRCW